jgi:hypothetical protein
MGYEKTLWTEVGDEGVITVRLPELKEGQKVEVTVTTEGHEAPHAERRLGWLKGKVNLMPNFDDPIPGIEEYR